MTDILMSLDVEVFIHLFFWIAIILLFSYAWHTKNKYLKLSYTMVGLLIWFYSLFIENTVCLLADGVNVLGCSLIQYSMWLASLYFVLIGVYWLFQ